MTRNRLTIPSLLFILLYTTTAWADTAPPPEPAQSGVYLEVDVSIAPDVDTASGKVIVFPVMLMEGDDFATANREFSVDTSRFLQQWQQQLGAEHIHVVSREDINRLDNGWPAARLLVRAVRKISDAPHSEDAPTAFFHALNQYFAGESLALGLVYQDADSYEADQTLRFYAALFDLSSGQARWITHARVQQTPQMPYQAALNDLIESSWLALQAKNQGAVR